MNLKRIIFGLILGVIVTFGTYYIPKGQSGNWQTYGFPFKTHSYNPGCTSSMNCIYKTYSLPGVLENFIFYQVIFILLFSLFRKRGSESKS